MPPPNITGQLHMGHALDNTMQDILIRYKRMQGYEALWQPGTDHAAIATEVKVIDKLKSEGIDKHDLGREGFLEKAWEWKEEYGNRIVKQLHKLGSSADWDRERFTMDEGCSDAVLEVFTKLYEKGYIYKGSRIINWCPVCQTSISDAEVEHEEQDGFFWHINYPIVGEEGRFVEIATTRPETLLGDTAVAVNPEDERYKDLIGKMLKLPLTDREIPVIADEYVDKEFGTGCVKITPAHDPNDFEVGKRHNLPEICIMNDDATINVPGKYFGMDRYEARKAMVEDLKEQGAAGEDRSPFPQRRHPRPLQDNGGAYGKAPVVCEDGRDGKAGCGGAEIRQTEIRTGELRKDVSPLAGGNPRLVYLQTALVGTQDSCILL